MNTTRLTKKTPRLTPAERARWRRLAEQREREGRPDLAAACRALAGRSSSTPIAPLVTECSCGRTMVSFLGCRNGCAS